jgi:hypothetical protein
MLGHNAERAFGKARGLHAEHSIEAGPPVLPGDGRRKLDELRLIEVLVQAFQETGWNVRWCLGHFDGEVEYGPFALVKRLAGFVHAQVDELLLRDAPFSADGRADIESEGAAYERAGLDLRQRLQAGLYAAARHEACLEAVHRQQERWTLSQESQRFQWALLPAHHSQDGHKPRDETHGQLLASAENREGHLPV